MDGIDLMRREGAMDSTEGSSTSQLDKSFSVDATKDMTHQVEDAEIDQSINTHVFHIP